MVLNLVRNEGVPALAYSLHDASVLWPCSLKILHSGLQFVVSLEHSISIPGVDHKQLVIHRYEGDNMMPGNILLRNVDVPLSDQSLRNIARHGQPRPRTLFLTLKSPCSVWYPHSFGKEVSSIHTRFHDLLAWARATEVCILFDTNWLGINNLSHLESAVEGSQQLTGLPVLPQFARLYQQADWSVLNLVRDASCEALPSIEDAVHDAPPPYVHVSSKRARKNRTSLTPDSDSPLPKRLFQDAQCAPSSTERATSPLSSGSNPRAPSTATAQVDVLQDIVTSAVEKVLPDMLRAQVPEILRELLAGASSPSLSPRPHSVQITDALNDPPSHKPIPTPAAAFRAIISTHAETHIQRILTDAVDRASELHDTAGVEFDEYLDDTRLEFAALKEDNIAAFNSDCNDKLDEFKDRLVEEKDEAEIELEERADKVVLKTLDVLGTVDNVVCWRCKCKCLHGAKDRQSEWEQGRRSRSLPL
ncbi:hypothetical protein IQ07DRAFT_584233 [Pyrenochaeta sp. DS3sAY3a]|nr:hypothetical protein IQ07DRAFT_584233 [Pyrenochaeta sp. DS3sAY3a]